MTTEIERQLNHANALIACAYFSLGAAAGFALGFFLA
jgi:hypothetical protein